MLAPSFVISNKMLQWIGEIEACRQIIELVDLSAEWEGKFKEDALIRSIYHGIRSDGGSLGRDEIGALIREDPGRDENTPEVVKRLNLKVSVDEFQSAVNYRNAIRFSDQLSRLSQKTAGWQFLEKELGQMHSLMMEKINPAYELGVYRNLALPASGGWRLRPPLPVEVPYQMDDLWFFLKRSNRDAVHPIIKAGIVYLELKRIQPFRQGSNRVANVYLRLILTTEGYSMKHFLSLEEHLDNNKPLFIQAIQRTEEDPTDISQWLEYFVFVISSEASKIKERVKRLAAAIKIGDKNSRQIALTERQVALMEVFRMNEEMTMSQAREILPMVSDDSILRDLNGLVGKKLVRKKGKTKGAKYIIRRSEN
ncbi:Fic family protein [Candidatus Collierbacteria bacterium]|nr:Fic family protein [Candidatus Collierbacteria bacterium]